MEKREAGKLGGGEKRKTEYFFIRLSGTLVVLQVACGFFEIKNETCGATSNTDK